MIHVAHLGTTRRRRVVYYGVDDVTAPAPAMTAVRTSAPASTAARRSPMRNVLRTRRPLALLLLRNARPAPQVRITHVALGDESDVAGIATPDGEMTIVLPLAGLYNAYNALAAAAAALALRLPRGAIVSALDAFSAAFGGRSASTSTAATCGAARQVSGGANRVAHDRPFAAPAAGGRNRTRSPAHSLLPQRRHRHGRDISWISTSTTRPCHRTGPRRSRPAPARRPRTAPEVRRLRRLGRHRARHRCCSQRALDATPPARRCTSCPRTPPCSNYASCWRRAPAAASLGGRMTAPTLRVAHLYLRLMNIDADRGNIMCLRHRCEARGIGFELTGVSGCAIGSTRGARPDLRRRRQDREQRGVVDDLLETKTAPCATPSSRTSRCSRCAAGRPALRRFYREASGPSCPRRRLRPAHRPPPANARRLIGDIVADCDPHAESLIS